MTDEYLSNLPIELLHIIFHYCDAETIFCKISLVCKRLRAVVYQYNQIELKFSGIYTSTLKRTLHLVPRHAIKSLILALEYSNPTNDQLCSFISEIRQFEQLRSLSFHHLQNEHLQMFLENLNYIELTTLEIIITYKPTMTVLSLLASITKRLTNLQKFSLTSLKCAINDILSFGQCNVTHLIIDKCLYSEYLAILHHFPFLKTFQLNQLAMNSDNSTPISQLTCLIIRDCSLLTEHLKLLVSKTPVLHHLKLIFRKSKKFESLVDIYDWERFVRTELNFLHRLEFFMSYELPLNDAIYFEPFVIPFQEPFWLTEKRWFVVCEYDFSKGNAYKPLPHQILVYTMPNTYGAYHGGSYYRKHGILFKHDNYYITEYSRSQLINTTPCNTLVELDIHSNGLRTVGAQYLAHMLQNNQTLAILNLNSNQIETLGTQYIMDVLKNTTTLTTLDISWNSICDAGAQHVSNFLQTNQTLTLLNIGGNKIENIGIWHLVQALLNNITLKTLVLSHNSINKHGIKHLAHLLAINKTLHTLHVVSNAIRNQELTVLCNALRRNRTLKELDLSQNEIGNAGVQSLAEILRNKTALEIINLKNNNIEDDGAHFLASALQENTTVSKLNLASNKIDTRGINDLLNKLKGSTTLIELSLMNNMGSGCNGALTYIKICNIPSLTQISTRNIDIYDGGACIIARALEQNKTLKELDLSHTSITERGTCYLAEALQKNTALEVLDLTNNDVGIGGVNALMKALQYNQSSTLTTLFLGEIRYLSKVDLNEFNMAPLLRKSKIFPCTESTEKFHYYLNALKIALIIRTDEQTTELDITGQYFGFAGAQHIADALSVNKTLKILHINLGQINGLSGVQYFIKLLKDPLTQVELYLGGTTTRNFLCINTVDEIRADPTITTITFIDEHMPIVALIYLTHAMIHHSMLTEFTLIRNRFKFEFEIYVANIIRWNTMLEMLCIEKNSISEEGMMHLASALNNHMALKTLILSRNDIGSFHTKYLADAIQNNTILTTLILKNNQIKDEGAKHIANALQTSQTLVEIDLTNNHIGDVGTYHIGNALLTNNVVLNTLLKLSLETNEIGVLGSTYIANALQKNTTLNTLHLGRNKIGAEGTKHLVHALSTNQTLQRLILFHNRIGDDGAQYLIKLLQTNNTLIELDIGSNGINRETRKVIDTIL